MVDWEASEDKNELEAYAKDKFGVDLDKRKKLKTLKMEIAKLEAEHGSNPRTEETRQAPAQQEAEQAEVQGEGLQEVIPSPDSVDKMNDLVRRIWLGQSVSLPLTIRKSRIISRLKEKGYTDAEISDLELPK